MKTGSHSFDPPSKNREPFSSKTGNLYGITLKKILLVIPLMHIPFAYKTVMSYNNVSYDVMTESTFGFVISAIMNKMITCKITANVKNNKIVSPKKYTWICQYIAFMLVINLTKILREIIEHIKHIILFLYKNIWKAETTGWDSFELSVQAQHDVNMNLIVLLRNMPISSDLTAYFLLFCISWEKNGM